MPTVVGVQCWSRVLQSVCRALRSIKCKKKVYRENLLNSAFNLVSIKRFSLSLFLCTHGTCCDRFAITPLYHQEIKHLHQPRLVWNGSDSSLPPLQRRTSTNRITANQATEKSEKSRGVQRRSCCNLVPDRGFRSKWDLFIMLALLIEIMFLPLQALLESW